MPAQIFLVFADLNETDLELAKARLLRFNVVLRLENLSVSILRMAAFGWTQLTDVSHNPRRRVPSPEIRGFLKQRQQWDLLLSADTSGVSLQSSFILASTPLFA